MAAPFDPVQDAFETAVREFKADLKDDVVYNQLLSVTSMDQVYDVTEKLQEEQARTGHLRHLSKIRPYLTCLDEYTNAAGVFIQVKPDILALIWGPIVLLLQWANVLKESFDAIVNTIAEIGATLPEFQRVVQMFGRNTQLADLLLLFFKDILDFYLIVIKFFRSSRLKIMFKALWPTQRDKIKVIAANIERHKYLIRSEVAFEHIQREHEARQRALAHFERTEKAHQDQEYRGIKIDISPNIYNDELITLQSQACEGTDTWLLKDPTYLGWLDPLDTSSKMLWLQGIPGAGKTFLSAAVAKHTEQHAKSLFVLLSYRHANCISSLSVLHSLIFQLTADDAELQIALCQLKCEALKTSIEVANQVLSSLLLYHDIVYIIVDGLDEVSEFERGRLGLSLVQMVRNCQGVKILLSSRPEADLKKMLDDKALSVRVDEQNSESIHAFIKQRSKALFQARGFTPYERMAIERWLDPLAAKAKGMFLYAKIVLDTVEFLNDIAEIENELRVLPESLDAAYERVLARVNGLTSTLREQARKLLGWIACSPTPLKLQEARHALAVKPDDTEGTIRLMGNFAIDKICGPIVEVIDECIQFVHFTVKEYILSPRIAGYIDERHSIYTLLGACISYLCQRHHDPGISEERIKENTLNGLYVLHDFASENWLELVRLLISFYHNETPSDTLVHLLQKLQSERTNIEYKDIRDEWKDPTFDVLEPDWLELDTVLTKASHFRHICLTSQYRYEEGSGLSDLDPLTITGTSILIREATANLMDCKVELHNVDCCCGRIKKYYGSRPFKCSFTYCPSRRTGFQTKFSQYQHEKKHDRPWKCSVPTCTYVNGGFLSRKMRDDHLDQHHRAEEDRQSLQSMTPPNQGEAEAILSDLVQTDNIEAVKAFFHSGTAFKIPFYELASICVSPAMLDLVTHNRYVGEYDWDVIARMFFRDRKFVMVKPVLSKMVNKSPLWGVCSIFDKVLRSDFVEIYDLWSISADKQISLWEAKEAKSLGLRALASTKVLKAVGQDRYREQLLLKVWHEKGVLKSLEKKHFGDVLANIAQANCSTKFASLILNTGVSVDYKNHAGSFTPLQHAARRTSAEAAELMKVFLNHGADPNLLYPSDARCIRDQKGPRGISRWLGMSWDELVMQTQPGRTLAEVESEEHKFIIERQRTQIEKRITERQKRKVQKDRRKWEAQKGRKGKEILQENISDLPNA